MQTAIQLYTLADLGESVPDLVDRVGETSLDGVEFAGLGDAAPETVGNALDRTGLDAAGAHVDAAEIEDDPAGLVEHYQLADCLTFVVPYLDESHFAGRNAVGNTARRLDELAGYLEQRDAQLCYHNHDHEFVDVNGETAYEALADSTDVALELDAGWAMAAGHDPADLIRRYSAAVTHVHLKDVDADSRTPVELGEGDLDADAVVDAARTAGVDWLIYEHDDPDDPAASLAHGAETLADLVGN